MTYLPVDEEREKDEHIARDRQQRDERAHDGKGDVELDGIRMRRLVRERACREEGKRWIFNLIVGQIVEDDRIVEDQIREIVDHTCTTSSRIGSV